MSLKHREIASNLISGDGLEIGGLHNPFKLPNNCTINYLDVADKQTLAASFPELNPADLVEITYIGDICKNNITEITNRKFDFVIANHVLEHIANPIKTLEHIWQGVNDNGYLVISVPDKNYSYDKERQLTSFDHLLSDYYRNINEADDDHYVDFLEHIHPETFKNRDTFLNALKFVRNRREHVHVWDSDTFSSQLLKILDMFGSPYSVIFSSYGKDNLAEFFSIVFKGNAPDRRKFAMQVLLTLYKLRTDLRNHFLDKGKINIKELINWAINCGCSIDSDSYLLKQYLEQYKLELLV